MLTGLLTWLDQSVTPVSCRSSNPCLYLFTMCVFVCGVAANSTTITDCHAKLIMSSLVYDTLALDDRGMHPVWTGLKFNKPRIQWTRIHSLKYTNHYIFTRISVVYFAILQLFKVNNY